MKCSDVYLLNLTCVGMREKGFVNSSSPRCLQTRFSSKWFFVSRENVIQTCGSFDDVDVQDYDTTMQTMLSLTSNAKAECVLTPSCFTSTKMLLPRMLFAVCKFLFINSNWTVWHKMNTVHQIELFCFWISIEKLTYIINATKRKHCKKVHCMLMVPLTKERGQHPGACGIRCLWIDSVYTC